MEELNFFRVNTCEYQENTDYWITRPASINHPKDNAVMFIMGKYSAYRKTFFSVSQCLIFWPQEWDVPDEVATKNAVVPCPNPHLAFCEFFATHQILGLYSVDEVRNVGGALIAKTAKIGSNTTVFPGAYIGGQVTIGDGCFIGAGVKIVGRVKIGDRVRIRENTVIGTDGLSTDRNEEGHPVTMPQFGGVVIENDVHIGANVVVARGAIDDTILHQGCKVDSSSFISHNVSIGEESFVVGSSILFGSSSVGRQAQISGGCVVGNYVHIGNRAFLGMGSVATTNIPDGWVAYGVPAKPIKKKGT